MVGFSSKIKTVLEMGTYEMRLMTLELANSGEIRLEKCLSMDTPRDFIVSTYIETPIIDPEPIKKVATSLIKEAKLLYENVALLLPDHSSLLDVLIAPPRYSLEETEEAIKENIELLMPIPFDNWLLTHQTIGSLKDEEIILSIATIRKNLLEVGGIIQSSGLNPTIIDLNILNVINLIEHYLTNNENKGKSICIVHLGHESTSICLLKDGVLRSLQNRPIGACDFTKQLSKHFHVSEPDADLFKRNEIFFLPEVCPEQEVQYNYTVIKHIFAVLCREIFTVIESYMSKFREFNIHEVIISGGGANFENIKVLLESNFNIRVKQISELYKLYVAGQQVNSAERNALAAACGYFLRN